MGELYTAQIWLLSSFKGVKRGDVCQGRELKGQAKSKLQQHPNLGMESDLKGLDLTTE